MFQSVLIYWIIGFSSITSGNIVFLDNQSCVDALVTMQKVSSDVRGVCVKQGVSSPRGG